MGDAEPADRLDALLRPHSVAIIGASDDPTRTGGRPLQYLIRAGFRGPIWPINPNRRTVQGLDAYPSMLELPSAPDVALIAVPAEVARNAFLQCALKGARGIICFTAGFAEVGAEGRAAQAEITQIARDAAIPVLGPNCLGVHSAHDGFVGTFASILDRGLPVDGPVGIVSQSGAFGMYLAYLAQGRGLGVAHAVTTGNEADVDLSQVLLWLARQPHVKVIMAHAESIRDGERFIAALEAARAARKPVVFAKVGASVAGAKAASSHTDALAGQDAVFDAILRQFGAIRATTTEEQVDIAYAAVRGVYPAGRRLGVVTGSGGVGVQMCDAAERFGLELPPLPDAGQRAILEMLPFAAPANPIDVTAQALGDMTMLARTLRIAVEQGGYDALVAAFLGLPLARPFAGPLRDALVEGTRGHEDRLIVLNVNADPDVVRDYERQGFLVFEDATRAVRAVAALVRLREGFERAPPVSTDTALDAFHPLEEAFAGELAAKRLLARAGIPILEERLTTTADQAAKAAASMGEAVAMKIVSPDIPHKTEIGGVLLGVRGETAVREGFGTLIGRGLQQTAPDRIMGVLVTPMAGPGVEVILGVSHDPVFGPMVMFGLGGVFVEVLGDVTFRRAPFDLSEALAMIGEIRGRAMLDGVRGAPPSDVDALADAIVALSRFAAAHADQIDSIDINPLLVRPSGQGVAALDAVIVERPTEIPCI